MLTSILLENLISVIVCIVIQLELDMDGLRQPCRRLAQLCVETITILRQVLTKRRLDIEAALRHARLVWPCSGMVAAVYSTLNRLRKSYFIAVCLW